MTNGERFHKAHTVAKHYRSYFACYRDAFAFALAEVYAWEKRNMKDWNIICGWFFKKSDISYYAFHDGQIVAETEKAVKVRCAVRWKNGVNVMKEVWIPKAAVSFGFLKPSIDSYGAVDPEHAEFMRLSKKVDAGEISLFEASKAYAKHVAYMYA